MLIAAAVSLALLCAPAAPGAGKWARLDLLVNGAAQGTALVLLRGDEVLVREDDLDGAGLRRVRELPGARERINDASFVSLASLGQRIGWKVEEKTLTLRLTAAPDLFEASMIDLTSSPRPPGLVVGGALSGFVNYSVQFDTDKQLGGAAELGVSASGRLLATGVSRRSGETILRGFSNLTVDEVSIMRRVVLGDQAASTGLLGGTVVLAGAGVSREFSLDPYRVLYSLPRVIGVALVPSTLEVYVNDVLVKREALAPGVFELDHLPVMAGSGSIRTVVRDAFGAQDAVSPYYFTSGLLERGLDDYAYLVGPQRRELATSSFSYGAPVFLARHRVGLSEEFTGGLRLEGGLDRISGGTTATVRIPVGELQLDLSASRQGSRGGAAASLGFAHASRWGSFNAAVRTRSLRYATTSLDAADDRARLEANLLATLPIASVGALGVGYTASLWRDNGRPDRLFFNGQVSLGRGASLLASVGSARQTGSAPALEALAMVIYSFGGATSANVAVQRQDQTTHGLVQVQRGLPLGDGLGYQVQAESGVDGQATGLGLFQAQGPHGRYEVSYQRTASSNLATATVSGGIVAIGGSVFATRPVQQGYALVQVPGVEGVRGFLENQEVGRTNRNGDLLVPNLLPYYGSHLSISGNDVPLRYQIAASSELAAAPFHGGALVRFGVRQMRSIRGTIEVQRGGKTIAPAYGQLTLVVGERKLVSPLGSDGTFYLENVPAGRFPALLEFGEGECRFTLAVADSLEQIQRLGALRCGEDGSK